MGYGGGGGGGGGPHNGPPSNASHQPGQPNVSSNNQSKSAKLRQDGQHQQEPGPLQPKRPRKGSGAPAAVAAKNLESVSGGLASHNNPGGFHSQDSNNSSCHSDHGLQPASSGPPGPQPQGPMMGVPQADHVGQ